MTEQNPLIALSAIHAQGSMISRLSRAEIDTSAAITPKVRMWPTRCTSQGTVRQPAMKPAAQPVPIRPISDGANPSRPPRIGSSSMCTPPARNKKAAPVSKAATGSNWRLMDRDP